VKIEEAKKGERRKKTYFVAIWMCSPVEVFFLFGTHSFLVGKLPAHVFTGS
jgi:hypothetical protein